MRSPCHVTLFYLQGDWSRKPKSNKARQVPSYLRRRDRSICRVIACFNYQILIIGWGVPFCSFCVPFYFGTEAEMSVRGVRSVPYVYTYGMGTPALSVQERSENLQTVSLWEVFRNCWPIKILNPWTPSERLSHASQVLRYIHLYWEGFRWS